MNKYMKKKMHQVGYFQEFPLTPSWHAQGQCHLYAYVCQSSPLLQKVTVLY